MATARQCLNVPHERHVVEATGEICDGAPRKLLAVWPVTPHLAVAVEDSHNILLVTREGTGPRHTISNVDELRWQLSHAQGYVRVRETELACNGGVLDERTEELVRKGFGGRAATEWEKPVQRVCAACDSPKGEPHQDWCPVVTGTLSSLPERS